jgi:hypothetical protein
MPTSGTNSLVDHIVGFDNEHFFVGEWHSRLLKAAKNRDVVIHTIIATIFYKLRRESFKHEPDIVLSAIIALLTNPYYAKT